MPDRIERRLWPHEPIPLSIVITELVTFIESERWFPREWKPQVPGEPVFEGGVVERKSSSEYIYYWQRHHPLAPEILAEASETTFNSSTEAAKHYLKWDLNLPGDLDGWTIVDG